MAEEQEWEQRHDRHPMIRTALAACRELHSEELEAKVGEITDKKQAVWAIFGRDCITLLVEEHNITPGEDAWSAMDVRFDDDLTPSLHITADVLRGIPKRKD